MDAMDAMDENTVQAREAIGELLFSQRLAVLSTQRHGQPYSSLMAFANTSDLSTILVATATATRKHWNILSEPRVALLFDNRSNRDSDFHNATALTALGDIEPITPAEEEGFRACYLRKQPSLTDFIAAPTTILMKITIRHYLLVNRFQQVMELHLTEDTNLFSQERH